MFYERKDNDKMVIQSMTGKKPHGLLTEDKGLDWVFEKLIL